MSLGIYISVPFCRAKCSYCNFASGVFSAAKMERYVERVTADVAAARPLAAAQGAELPSIADTVYLGGGTPSILEIPLLERLFHALRTNFDIASTAEVTMECAPGQISDGLIAVLPRLGVNRVSLGMQSFIDQEARAVGRMHTAEVTLSDLARLRAAGISNINLDLIAGLPHQTAASWTESLERVIATNVPHLSVYMLEVDDDSRLGRELIAGGTRYHAHHVPDDDLVADLYSTACEKLAAAGIPQYEISNFARPGIESTHNLKYWTRQPYIGFGLDAHSMLFTPTGVVRFSTTDDLDQFLSAPSHTFAAVKPQRVMEEELFLGLRLNRGIDLEKMQNRGTIEPFQLEAIARLLRDGLLQQSGTRIFLSSRGRLLSNEVFACFLVHDSASVAV